MWMVSMGKGLLVVMGLGLLAKIGLEPIFSLSWVCRLDSIYRKFYYHYCGVEGPNHPLGLWL